MARLLSSHAIQAKLKVAPSGDRFEAEADRIADAVVREPASGSTSSGISRQSISSVQRKCAHCEEEEKLQRKSSGTERGVGPVSHSLENSIESARRGGHEMPRPVRQYFEPRFGTDLTGVRLHTDANAGNLASAIGARAFTSQQDIFFAHGQYQPESPTGQRLLAHELTHTVQQRGTNSLHLQREEDDKGGLPPADVELGTTDKILIGAFAGPAYPMGSTVHSMVEATGTGFVKQVKAEAKPKGDEFWGHVKDKLTFSGIASFVLHYWWGLIKGIFSPITGLIDLGKLAIQLSILPSQILATAWTKRNELAENATELANGMSNLGDRVSKFFAGLKSHPIDTVKALANWFSSLSGDAIKAAEKGGRSAGHALVAQIGKPLNELGETAGEIIGTVLINIVLLVFTEGIGNAITQIAGRIGELGSFLGKFGKAAEMLGAIVSKLGTLLETIGGWVAKAEAAIAKVTEAVLKPIAPVLEEFGKLVSGLRTFLRKLLGVSEEAAASVTEQGLGKAAQTIENKVPPLAKPATPKPTTPKPTMKAPPSAVDEAASAGVKATPKATPPKPVTPVVAEPKPPAVPPAKPTTAKIFEGISEDTEALFQQRPGLRKALEEHPDAAKLFKICKSPCIFPKFMTDEQVAQRLARIEKLKAGLGKLDVEFDEKLVKQLLNKSNTIEEVDNVLNGLDDRLRKNLLGASHGEPAESALARPQPKTPKPPRERLDPNAPPKQFENMPEELPEGHGDLAEKHGDTKTPTPGGKAESTAAAVGKDAHSLAEILQNDPQVIERLIRETGSANIFNRRLPEGMIPEYTIPHPDFPGRKPRIDRLWRQGETIFEIKPNTMPAAKGLTQAQEYANWMQRYGELPPSGGRWNIEVITYDQAALTRFFRAIGKLPPL
jgi:hypothetical protein